MCRRFYFYLSVRERIKNCDTQNKYLMSVDFYKVDVPCYPTKGHDTLPT